MPAEPATLDRVAGFSYSGGMDTNEPPHTATERTETQPADVQPAHEPSLTPPGPYSGPKDKASVIQAVIDGRCTTREAGDILGATPATVRVWTQRARERGTKPPRVLRQTVTPPVTDTTEEPERIEDQWIESVTPDEPSTLQDLQIEQGATPATAPEAERNTLEAESVTPTECETVTPVMPPIAKLQPGRPAHHMRGLMPGNHPQPKPSEKLKEDEGSFERDELDTLGNLHRAMIRNLRTAKDGKDAQAWSVAMLNVLDARRRAAGKDSTLVKTQSAKALSTRNSVVFIGNMTPPTAAPSLKIAKLQPQVIDVQPEASSDQPPALQSALKAAPSYVREL